MDPDTSGLLTLPRSKLVWYVMSFIMPGSTYLVSFFHSNSFRNGNSKRRKRLSSGKWRKRRPELLLRKPMHWKGELLRWIARRMLVEEVPAVPVEEASVVEEVVEEVAPISVLEVNPASAEDTAEPSVKKS